MPDVEVAVLGGGISGCLAACLLADAGRHVVIVEQRPRLMDGASRWNDGKIHLGYTFTGTDSLATTELLLRGASVFVPIVERVLGWPLKEAWFGRQVVYIVDPESIYDAETLWRRAQSVAGLIARSNPDGGTGLRAVTAGGPLLERLSVAAAERETGLGHIAAAWRTSERHVASREIAAALADAVKARGIPVVTARVRGVAHAASGGWRVMTEDGNAVNAAVVVNSLWEGRAVVDTGVAPESRANEGLVIRYKHCLFGTNTGLAGALAPSTRILGRFGDVATYDNGDAYLSWYPVALAARSDDGAPPTVPARDPEEVIAATLAGLGLPRSVLEHPGAEWIVNGGHIVAFGRGDVDDRRSLLHTRDRAGVRELRPGYFSVDTGKYTLGPLMATRVVELAERRLAGRRRADGVDVALAS